MKAGAPKPATTKAGAKRPTPKLNKETLRDLSAAGKTIKGGRMMGDTLRNSCSCDNCS